MSHLKLREQIPVDGSVNSHSKIRVSLLHDATWWQEIRTTVILIKKSCDHARDSVTFLLLLLMTEESESARESKGITF